MSTFFTGHKINHVKEIGSTNDWAAREIREGSVLEGAVFRADSQTKGKGQRGRVWESGMQQNLLLSYVFYPKFLLSTQQFGLIQCFSLAVKDVLQKYVFEPITIKWPNDIYVGESKVAGILIESSMVGNYLGTAIVGIGLNVNQRDFSTVPNATSLLLETGQKMDLDLILNQLNEQMEFRYLQLKANNKSCQKEYLESLFRKNQWVNFEINQTVENMKIIGVEPQGRLVLLDKHDNQRVYSLHEIKMVI